MEYFRGSSLSAWIKDKGPLRYDLAIELFMQICDGLTAAQKLGMVHRDLKPANILLRIDGTVLTSKILDFGLAKLLDDSGREKMTMTGDILGSPPYMPPEQWSGQTDHRSDLYAFGCIMYEVLSGKPAYVAQFGFDYLNKHLNETPARISEVTPNAKFPGALEDILRKCLQKSPANRYQSSVEVRADLRKVKVGRGPLIVLSEDKKTIQLKYVACGIAGVMIIGAIIFCLRDFIVSNICTSMVSQADQKLMTGNEQDAIALYRNSISLSQFLPKQDKRILHSMRNLSNLLKEDNKLTAARNVDKQLSQLIGALDIDAELKSLYAEAGQQLEKRDYKEAERTTSKGIELAKLRFGPRSGALSDFFDQMAAIKIAQDDNGTAADYERQAVDLADDLAFDEGFIVARLKTLSHALHEAGQIAQAKTIEDRIVALEGTTKGHQTTLPPLAQNETKKLAPTKLVASSASQVKVVESSAPAIPAAPSRPAALVQGTSNGSTSTGAPKQLPVHKTAGVAAAELAYTKPITVKRPAPIRPSQSNSDDATTQVSQARSTLETLRKAGQSETIEAARAWARLGKLYLDLNQVSYAEPCLEQALRLREKLGSRERIVPNVRMLVFAKKTLGKNSEAAYLERKYLSE
jgi:tetratricopeptide (TPR) repeat protein